MPRPIDPEVVHEIVCALAEAVPEAVCHYSIEELVDGVLRYAHLTCTSAVRHTRAPEALRRRIRASLLLTLADTASAPAGAVEPPVKDAA